MEVTTPALWQGFVRMSISLFNFVEESVCPHCAHSGVVTLCSAAWLVRELAEAALPLPRPGTSSNVSGTESCMASHLNRSNNSPIGPNVIEIPIFFQLCEVDSLDSLDVSREVYMSHA